MLSPFLLWIDWTTNQVSNNSKPGIYFSLAKQLEDLDFAYDIALLAHNHQQMQGKSHKLEITAATLGLKMNTPKAKVMRIINKDNTPITVDHNQLEEVDGLRYLGSKMIVD